MAKILLMDDDIRFGFETAKVLQNAGHEVTTCHTGQQAREELLADTYDILVTDIIVRVDGVAVPDGGVSLIGWIRVRVRTYPTLTKLKILAISGSVRNPGMEYILTTAQDVGADTALAKPIIDEDLLSVVDELLEPA